MAAEKNNIRSTIEIPAPLYRALKQQAAQQGTSVRELIMQGAKLVLLKSEPAPHRRVTFPLIESRGPKFRPSNEELFEPIEFPRYKRLAGE
jgi:hypothetical protein